jgi:hypothetical protein
MRAFAIPAFDERTQWTFRLQITRISSITVVLASHADAAPRNAYAPVQMSDSEEMIVPVLCDDAS